VYRRLEQRISEERIERLSRVQLSRHRDQPSDLEALLLQPLGPSAEANERTALDGPASAIASLVATINEFNGQRPSLLRFLGNCRRRTGR
jgi:hypothetical protein